MGVSWNTLAFEENGNTFGFVAGRSGALRSLGGAFTNTSTGGQGQIVIPSDGINDGQTIPINNSPPSPPGTVDLAGAVLPLGSFTGLIGDVSVDAQLRALSRRNGSDMLSAPKVTVMSGSRATITVAQELRYPQSYGEIQSDVGTSGGGGGLTGGGSAGVTITAGTPSDFTTRNVGVELSVTPTVEEDDYSISLELNPRVTEFEGYVEYGGTSVAVSQGTTVTVPSGFYQPVFSSREINTRVTVWDGATLVMGGLTREEVRRVNDKVPVLGDIPFIGRAFQSKGEASEKRNLLVFVTANLVSPGGSLKKQRLKGVEPSSLFQNPTVVTPGGSESRVRVTTEQ
jgi:general secretion pathway protein D